MLNITWNTNSYIESWGITNEEIGNVITDSINNHFYCSAGREIVGSIPLGGFLREET